jgi:hypothetical protein
MRAARTWWAPFTSRSPSSPTSPAWTTLPERELRAGIAEVIKHGFILDLQFVGWLEANIDKLLARERAALEYAVRRSCELKRRWSPPTNASRASARS